MCDMLSKDSHAYFQLVFRLVWCEDFYLLIFLCGLFSKLPVWFIFWYRSWSSGGQEILIINPPLIFWVHTSLWKGFLVIFFLCELGLLLFLRQSMLLFPGSFPGRTVGICFPYSLDFSEEKTLSWSTAAALWALPVHFTWTALSILFKCTEIFVLFWEKASFLQFYV